MRLRGCLSPDPKEKLLLMRTTEEQNNCQTCPAGGFKTMCGGQALIEGIMMRGPKKQAIVVRKPDGELDIEDMRGAAAYRGGKCLSGSMTKGDLYTKLQWECHDGHTFWASPYTVLKAGHWCPVCCQPEPWDFDRLAKFMPFYAQVWYDTHAREENTEYVFSGGKAMYRRY